MTSRQRNVDFVLEQMGEAGDVSARKMFGEYGIYCRGRLVALFCDDQLFVKPTAAGRAFIGSVNEGPPYPGAKAWFFVGGDQCEDGDWLSELIRRTASELPLPLPKPPKRAAVKKKRAQAETPTRTKARTKAAKKTVRSTAANQKAPSKRGAPKRARSKR